ncbi:MAG: ABC transporter permease, partial [Tannerellaceae bacterium]|nr:ABC transporter permease [Tannerellaceae bacterium]
MKSLKNNPLYRLSVSQLLETVREPEVLFWGMLFPVLISIGLGLAFTQKSELKFKVHITGTNDTELDSLLRRYAEPVNKDGKETHVWKITDNTLGDTEFTFVHSDWSQAIVSLKRGESDLIVSDSLGKTVYHFDP